MYVPDEELWLDDDAGRLVRPYTVTNGRTRPANELDLLTLVMATGRVTRAPLNPEHLQALDLCQGPTSVAEIASYLQLPVAITKVLLSDLMDCGAVVTSQHSPAADPTDRFVLEALLNGLQRRL